MIIFTGVGIAATILFVLWAACLLFNSTMENEARQYLNEHNTRVTVLEEGYRRLTKQLRELRDRGKKNK